MFQTKGILLVVIGLVAIGKSDRFDGLLHQTNVNIRNLRSVENSDVSEVRQNNYKDIQFRYYYGSTLEEYKILKLEESKQLLDLENFKKDFPTVFYIHGYIENSESISVKTVVEAYLKSQHDTNIILIDWSNMAFGSYIFNAAPNTRLVGNKVAIQLKELVNLGLSLEKIHIIGHSLGSHIAGFIGKEMNSYNLKLKRITGLDPAFQLFYPGLWGHINQDDAEMVDIIHTNPGIYGAPVSTGSVDFWPNPKIPLQPGCPLGIHAPLSANDLCSHWRSWRFWAESLSNPMAFPSVKAQNLLDYFIKEITNVENKEIVLMGIATNKNVTGNYYLTTNEKEPFGKGST